MKEWETRAIRQIVRHYQGSRMSYSDRLRIIAGDIGIDLNLSREKALMLADLALNPYKLPPESCWVDAAAPEISLGEEHHRQAVRMAQLFADKVGMTEEEYISSLPQFPDKPASFVRLRPLIVEGNRIPWTDQARLSGIYNTIEYSGIVRVVDWANDPRGFTTPDNPFTTWVSMSSKTDCNIPLARGRLTPTVRGGNVLEGIAYWNAYPHIAKGGLFSLPGSQVKRYYRAPDFTVKEYEREGVIYLNCPAYPTSVREASVLRSYGEEGLSCHTLVSSRDIRVAA